MRHLITIGILCLVSTLATAQLRLNANNQLLLNHTGTPLGSSSFTISQSASSFGGMYINATGSSGLLKPFYGYAVNGGIKSFQYFDEGINALSLNVNGADRFKIYSDSSTFLNTLVANEELLSKKGLSVGSLDFPTFKIEENGSMLMNTNSELNEFTDFTLNSLSTNTFGGMYINVEGDSGIPFYGFATGGVEKAWTAFNDDTDEWQMIITENKSAVEIITANLNDVQLNGGLLMNTSQQLNSFTDFTIQSKKSSLGGMFVNVDGVNAEPFYGYAVNGLDRAWTSYDEADDTWNLVITNPDPAVSGLKEMIQVDYSGVNITEPTQFDDYIILKPGFSGASGPIGTIYYYNGSFFGVTQFGIKQLDNTTSFAKPDNDEIDQLKSENAKLKEELDDLRSKLNRIEKYLESQIK